MNNEEAIEYIKNYKYDNEVRQAIDTVLNYIEELEEEKQQVLDDYQELGKDLANNFISKDKIRDKIGELETKKKKYGFGSIESIIFLNKVQVLNELLKEEKCQL